MISLLMNLKIKVIVISIISTALLSCFGYMYWQIQSMGSRISAFQRNEAVYDSAIKTQEDTIQHIKSQLSSVVSNQNDLFNTYTELQTTQNEISQELNNYRGRLGNVALEKPSLIGRRINNATDSLMQQFNEATGSNN